MDNKMKKTIGLIEPRYLTDDTSDKPKEDRILKLGFRLRSMLFVEIRKNVLSTLALLFV